MAQYLRHENYTIAWICAITVEVHAAISMLDERHNGIFPRMNGDDNVYEAGRIGTYNIVIASLPEQKTGNVAASRLMTQLTTSFRNLQYALMVGIGGGVPGPNGENPDIRLGDVVVAWPTDKSSGIENYELGKETNDGFLKRLDNSFRMNSVIQNTIRSIKLDFEWNGTNDFVEHLNTRKRKRGVQTATNGRSLHKPIDTLLDPATGQAVVRQTRSYPDELTVHYGAIASGEKVIKSVKQREYFRQEYGVLCIEMEAAGLRDSFPAAIIRGVSDYADGSKNDEWHEYASVVAAAYAKTVITKIPPRSEDMEYQSLIVEAQSNVPDEERVASRRACMESLFFEQIDARLTDIKPAHARTCKWLYEQREYKDWLDDSLIGNHHGLLWIKGKPGAGKSTIMKHAYNSKVMLKGATAISFFFSARGSDLEKSVLGMYRSLLYQLLQVIPSLQDALCCVYQKKAAGGVCDWKVNELQEFLIKAINDLPPQQRIAWFIDALDECEESEVREMVDFLESLGETATSHQRPIHICLASRHYPHISIQNHIELIVENQEGHGKDIEKYVHSKFKAPKTKLMDQIRTELLRKASGVFLWVVLVVNMLNIEYDHGRTRGLYKRLDEIPEKLDDLFADILLRDNNRKAETTLCLQWLLFSKRPLKCEELYFAVQSGLDNRVLEDWDPIDTGANNDTIHKFILSCSKGLAEVSKRKAKTVQFIHESVRDFFLHRGGLSKVDPRLQESIASMSEDRLKECCYQYIITVKFDGMLDSPIPQNPKDMTKLRESFIDQHHFLEYSCRYLFEHADISQQHGVSQENFLTTLNSPDSPGFQRWRKLQNIFERYPIRRYTSAVGLLYILSEQNRPHLVEALLKSAIDINVNAPGERYGSALQVASYNGFEAVVRLLIRADAGVNIPGGEHYNPLLAATLKGHTIIVDILVQNGADESCRSTSGQTPLHHACEKGHVSTVEYLLVCAQANPNSRDKRGRTPLHLALFELKADSLSECQIIVKLLLERGADVNAQGGLYGNALREASSSGNEAIVKLLLERGADVNAQGGHYGNALQAASRSGNEAIVKLLLERGADVNAQGGQYGNALQEASFSGSEAIVKLLLERGADVNAQGGLYGNALQAASSSGNEAIVKLLLERGADVNAQGGHHGNALQAASRSGNEAIVKLLLERGADVNAQGGQYGNALQEASNSGNEAIVKLLLERGADVNAQGGHYGNALQAASRSRNEAIVKLLLERGADVNAQGGHYGNAFQAASFSGNKAIVKLLLERGADVNAQGGLYGNALQAASRSGNKAIVKLLLERGADVNAQGGQYGNALQAASGNKAVLKLLRRRKAKINP